MRVMALERIASSGLAAQARLFEQSAERVARAGLPISTQVEAAQRAVGASERDAGAGAAGVARSGGVQLDPAVASSLATEDLDLPQALTSAVTARRAFEANIAVLRTADDLFRESLNLAA